MTNYKQGFFRLWVVSSVLWIAVSAGFLATSSTIIWPTYRNSVVHVKFSNTETWDFCCDLGEASITKALKLRLDNYYSKEREWANTLSQEKISECSKLPESMKFENMPPDCNLAFLGVS